MSTPLFSGFFFCGLQEQVYNLNPVHSEDFDAIEDFLLDPLSVKYIPKTQSNLLVKGIEVESDALFWFCFPDGAAICKIEDVHQPRFHSFTLTQENGTSIYATCVRYFTPKSPSETLTTRNIYDARDHFLAKTDFCDEDVERLSEYELTEPQYLREEPLFCEKAICLLSPLPFVTETQQVLRDLLTIGERIDLGLRDQKDSIESYLAILFSESAVSVSNSEITLKLIKEITFKTPPDNELPVLSCSFTPIFKALSPDLFIQLLSSCLMDEKIVVRSSNLELLSMVLHFLSSCMYPFHWCHSYVPILPACMLHYLEAPVPFMMGVPATLISIDGLVELANDLVIVDLDQGLLWKNDTLGQLFPNLEELTNKILELFVTNDNGQILEQASTTEDPTTAIRHIFFEHFATLITGYEDYISLNDTELSFDNVAFLAEFHGEKEMFIAQFLETQAFAFFLDMKRSAMLKNADRYTSNAIENFDNQIKKNLERNEIFKLLQDTTSRPRARKNVPLTKTRSMTAESFRHLVAPPKSNELIVSSSLVDMVEMDEGPAIKKEYSVRSFENLYIENIPINNDTSLSPRSAVNAQHSSIASQGGSNQPAIRRNSQFSIPSSKKEEVLRQGGRGPALDTHRRESRRESRTASEASLRAAEFTELVLSSLSAIVSKLCISFADRLDRIAKLKKARTADQSESIQKRVSSNPLIASEIKELSVEEISTLMQKYKNTKKDNNNDESPVKLVKQLLITKRNPNKKEEKENKENKNEEAHLIKVMLMEVNKLCTLLESIFTYGRKGSKNASAFWLFVTECDFPPNSDAFEDRERINFLTEVKTPVGQGRAFVKLCIEKGVLHNHLAFMLQETSLLDSLYKDHALLKNPETTHKMIETLNKLQSCDCPCFSDKDYVKEYAPVYHMHIITGDHPDAGTTSNVMCMLIGQNGRKSRRIYLQRTAQPFQRGDKNEFEVKANYLGALTGIVIGHDNTGKSPSWQVKHIIVEHVATGISYFFNCQRWLAKNRDDGEVVRLFQCETLNVTDNNGLSVANVPRKMTATEIDELGIMSKDYKRKTFASKKDVDIQLTLMEEDMIKSASRSSSRATGTLNIPASSTGRITSYENSLDEFSSLKKLFNGGEEREVKKRLTEGFTGNFTGLNTITNPTPKAQSEEDKLQQSKNKKHNLLRKLNFMTQTMIEAHLDKRAGDKENFAMYQKTLRGFASVVFEALNFCFLAYRGIFRSPAHLWDFVSKSVPSLNTLMSNYSNADPDVIEMSRVIGAITSVTNANNEQRFSWFLFVALKKAKIHNWMSIIANSSVVPKFYNVDDGLAMLSYENREEFLLTFQKLTFNFEVPNTLLSL